MKIAYLIITHNNFKHLTRLVSTLNNDNVDFYIHIDKKAKQDVKLDMYKNVYVLDKRLSVNWGGYSIVEATIELLKTAYANYNYTHFILLSGMDYPIKSNEYILDFFENNKGINFISNNKMPLDDKPLHRVEYYHIEGGYRNKNLLRSISIIFTNKFIRALKIKRRYPSNYRDYTLYAGSQWWAFSFEFVEYLMDFIDNNKDFVKFYKNTYVPDEMFFHTIIMNSEFKTRVKPSLTYTDWKIGDPPYPSIIDDRHLKLFYEDEEGFAKQDREFLFARKFNDGSTNILEKIDREKFFYN